MCLSRNTRIIKENIAPFVIAPSKLFSYAAQNVYTNVRAFQYFTHSTNHPVIPVMASIGVVSGALTTYFAKIPAIFETLGPQARIAVDPTPVEMGWRGRTSNFILRKASLSYGMLSAFVAYSTSVLLINTLMTAFDTNADLSLTKTIIKQIAGAIIFIGMLFAYYSYDYQYSKKNSDALSAVVDSGDYSCDKSAMTKTVVAAGLNLFTFTATAYFWGNAASHSLITSDSVVANFAASAITTFGCVVTFLTVLTWLPSAYHAFKTPSIEPDIEQPTDAENCASLTVDTSKYIAGVPDSVLNQGLSSFMGVILLMNKLFNTNLYNGYIIALAACGLLTSATINYFFSVKSGTDALATKIRHGFYNRDNICFGLFGLHRSPSKEELLSKVADTVESHPASLQLEG